MSNTSYSFKENSHMIVNQGGEKKVMKKILSVALSTAMAFSMFASVAFGADAKMTDEQQFQALKTAGVMSGDADGLSHLDRALTRAELAKIIVKTMNLTPVDATSYKDKNYAKHWGRTYIEAATQAGILNGKDATKKLFDPNGKVTVQELAKVLVTAMKLEVPKDANNTASAWAKGYVAAAVKAGYLADGINYQAQATRSQAVVAAYAIFEAAQVPTVKSYKVVDSKNVEFTLSNGEVVKVTLEKALEANKATDVTFKTKDGKEIKTSVTWAVTDATKVESVSADNLKEVVVKYDGEVDKATAQLKDNYKLSGNLAIKSAVLNDAKNTVVLTLDGDAQLQNQQKYTLTVSGVKAGSKVISANNIEFAPVDAKIPTVESVTGLGTKAIKVVFSEPVKQSYTGSFLLDGQGFYGTPSVNNREMVLRSSSDLTVGDHTLSVAGVEDYSGLKSLKSEHKFTVAEDKTAPTISEATATLEKLTVTFSEDIDPDTLSVDNVYHKRGDSKIKPTRYVKLSGNKYEFYFTKENALPSYATTIYVEGVKDYSGNQISETSKAVTAQIDTERPTVVDVRVPAGQKAQLAITFSKDLQEGQKWADLITVKDKDGKVRQVSGATFKSDDNHNILLVNFFSDLPEGTNTLDIKGIKDSTVLGNVLLDYSTTFTVGDSGAPTFAGASFKVDAQARRAVVMFSEKMDTTTLVNKANYVLTLDGKLVALPNEATITVTQDGKGVVIDLPIEIGGVDVQTKWTDLRIQGVKDTTGNYLASFIKDIHLADYSSLNVKDAFEVNSTNYFASLTGKKEIKVKLDQAVSKILDKSKVTVSGNTVNSVTADNTDVITIKVDNEISTSTGLTVTFAGAKFVGVAQNEIALTDKVISQTATTDTVIADQVKPEVKFATNVSTYNDVDANATDSVYKFEINFTETLRTGLDNFIGEDLIVTRLTDNKVLTLDSGAAAYYTAAVSGDKVIVTVNDGTVANANAKYSIEIKSTAKYIQDEYGNIVAAKSAVRTN
ncbi:Ig-like domain-containing protein [Paenibacillus puldeungensis]|uniref:Ig-like domain-containing protein n=1 Tax=Paenibacillus puldeungensis TaxID=696536 RepID=A0ABW3S5A8_9BACL